MTDEARVLPKMIPLRTVAAELGRTVRSLVTASASGRFVAKVAVGDGFGSGADCSQGGDNGEPVVSDAIEVPIGPKIGPSFPAITEADLLCGYGAAADVCVGCLP